MLDLRLILPTVPDSVLEREKHEPRKKARGGAPLKPWTINAIAARIGIDAGRLRRIAAEDGRVAELIDAPHGRRSRRHEGPGSGASVTSDDVARAADLVLRGHVNAWARVDGVRLRECVSCGSSERRHNGRGLCSLCYERKAKGRDPERLSRWAPRAGHRACVECGETGKPHHSRGLCSRCHCRKTMDTTTRAR